MVVVVERQTGAQWPCLPSAIAGGAGEQAVVGDDDQAGGKVQAGVEVDFEPGLDFFVGSQLRLDFGGPAVGERRLAGGEVLYI